MRAATAVFLIAAAICVAWFNYPQKPKTNGMQEFFSDDDGKTWFADDGTRIAPFDHNGKRAVMVKVYETREGKQFVGYMMKFTEDARKKVLEAQATHMVRTGLSVQKATASSGLLVKRPQDREWISESDPKAKQIKRVIAPDGSKDLTPVRP